MATTSFSLGPHWDEFIKQQVASGRYGSASEVVREALRRMEDEAERFTKLKADVEEGMREVQNGQTEDGRTVFDDLRRKYAHR